MKAGMAGATPSGVVLENVLGRLIGVEQMGSKYKATCPAHQDMHPSLSVCVGDRGILLKCWAGCSLGEICRAIDLSESDLFFDAPHAHVYKQRGKVYESPNLHWRFDWREQTGELLAITEARAILAEAFLERVKAVDADTLTDPQRDLLLEKIALAFAWVRLAEEAGDLCFTITQKMRKEEGHV